MAALDTLPPSLTQTRPQPPCPVCCYVYKEHRVANEWVLPFKSYCPVCGFNFRKLEDKNFNYKIYQQKQKRHTKQWENYHDIKDEAKKIIKYKICNGRNHNKFKHECKSIHRLLFTMKYFTQFTKHQKQIENVINVEDELNDKNIKNNDLKQSITNYENIEVDDIITTKCDVDMEIGEYIDVLSNECYWYSAKITNIVNDSKKQIYFVSTKGIGTNNDKMDCIAYKKQPYRIAEYLTRTVNILKNIKEKDYALIHCWAATRYAKNRSDVIDYGICKEVEHKVISEKPIKIHYIKKMKILIQGWMEKRGEYFTKKWKHRWCVLRNDYYLYYYTARQRPENEFKGKINLRNCKRIDIYKDKDSKTEFTFHISHYNDKTNKDRLYKFCCEKGIDLIDWMSILTAFVQTNNYPLKKMKLLKLKEKNKKKNRIN